MYAMGDPFTVDYQLGVCCTFAVGTKGHVRPWLKGRGHNMEFWVCNFGSLPFPGPERYRSPLYASGGWARQMYRYVRQPILVFWIRSVA